MGVSGRQLTRGVALLGVAAVVHATVVIAHSRCSSRGRVAPGCARDAWIVGGVDKGNDYTELEDMVKEKVKFIIALGEDVANIHTAFNGICDIYNAASMEEAIAIAYQFSTKGDAVLLSPACASFDLFENYEARGNAFKNAVRSL